jgi:glycosyltransferase involved in cell wall biosynthesis
MRGHVMHLDLLYVSFGQKFGPQQVAVNLLENLLDKKKLTILGVLDKETAKALPSKCGRDNFYVPKNSLSMILTLFVILLKNKPRVCHFNFPPLLLTPLLFLMKIKKTRIVYSFHGGILFENTRKYLKSLFLFQCKYFYDIIIANSKYSAQFLLQAENILEKKLVIIPNGVKAYEGADSTTKNIKGQPAVL